MPTPELNPHVPARYDTAGVDLVSVDGVLSTTRSVRLRLDLERDVPHDVVLDCIDIAEQGPGGGNQASRRWLLIRDPAQRQAIGEMYGSIVGNFMARGRDATAGTGHPMEQVMKSAFHLAEHLGEVPVIVIPCVWGVHDDSGKPGLFDSVLQSAWSFCLAARARGMATAWTTAILNKEDELREVLGIPVGVTPVALLPLAYAKGTEFGAVPRRRAQRDRLRRRLGPHLGAPGGRRDGLALWARGPVPRSRWTSTHRPNASGKSSATSVWAPISPRNAWGPSGYPATTRPVSGRSSSVTTGIRRSANGDMELTVTECAPNVLFGWATGDSDENRRRSLAL